MDRLVTGERKSLTRSAVYHCIYEEKEPLSKQDIARKLNLSFPTVYDSISDLLASGLIEYCGFRQSSGGRPAQCLRPVMNARSAIGISISSHRLRFVATDLGKQVNAYKDIRHSLNVEEPAFRPYIANQLELFIDENRIDRSRLLGVGITLAGLILPGSNTVFYAPTLYLKDLSLHDLLKAIPYPAFIENDANSGGFAEWYTSDTDEKNIAYLMLETGVGGSVLVNGAPYRGDHNRSGEFGHMCVELNGRECACGKRGCLEAYCSEKRFRSDMGLSAAEFFAKLRENDPDAVTLFEDYKRRLVTAILNIRLSLDCDIVLGGFISEYLEPYLTDLRSLLIEANPFDSDAGYLRIDRSPRYSTMLGVAFMYIRDFLNSL